MGDNSLGTFSPAHLPSTEGLEEFLVPLAQHFVAHLSGRVRLRVRAARAFFTPSWQISVELGRSGNSQTKMESQSS